MKSYLKSEFRLDLTCDAERKNLGALCELEMKEKRTVTLLADSQHVQVLYYEEANQFLVKLAHVGPTSKEEHYYFNDPYYAVLYACLMTTTSHLNDFIVCYGNENLVKFVCHPPQPMEAGDEY